MRSLTAKQITWILTRHGYVLSRQRGSHQIFHHPANGTMVPVPLHGKNRPLPLGTFLAIVKQSKIPKEVWDT